jgi:hypothetical protein
MMDTILQGMAIALAGTIFIRAVCVCYSTSPAKHRHPVLFVGFGYSYVLLGAGAVFGAVEICTASDLGGLPLWLMLAGSTGLIMFDRRLMRCWAVTECPMRPDDKP